MTRVKYDLPPPRLRDGEIDCERPMRIAFVITNIAPGGTGCTAVVAAQAHELCRRGHEVTVLASDLGYRGADPGIPAPFAPQVKVRIFPEHRRFARRVYRSLALRDWLGNNLAGFELVDIQGMWSFLAIDAARACLRAGVPYVFTPHGMMTRGDWAKRLWAKRVFFESVMRKFWDAAATVRFVSRGEESESAVPPRGCCAVIPNWIELPGEPPDLMGASSLRAKYDIAAERPIILFLGRIAEQKGVIEILQAFELLWRRRPDMTLMLVGQPDGEYGQAVRRLASQLESHDSIFMPGPLFGREKVAAFSAASLYITLSKFEGHPVAALEAMSWGLPAVLTRASNLPETDEYNAGAVVSDNPTEVAEILQAMMSDRKALAKMGLNARRLVEERFSPNQLAGSLENLYRNLIRNGDSTRAAQ
jgi:glycosyltransferase involved in cell wall biosynthesis